jgi:hypothetical protein
MRICRSHFHEHHRWMIAHQFHLFHTHCCLLTHLMITQSRCLASLILHFPLVNLCHLKMLKKTPLWKDIQGAIYTSREWSHIINNSDPLSGLSFPSYASQDINLTFRYNKSFGTNAMYTHWTA